LSKYVPDEDDEGSAEYGAKFEVPDASSEGGFARLERDRLVDLERQLSATLAAQSERDQRLAQLPVTDELALKTLYFKLNRPRRIPRRQ
jgi:hypothetical protein